MKSKQFVTGFIFLVLAQTMVALNIVISKQLLTQIPVMVVLEIRFLLATLVLMILHWLLTTKKKSIKTYFHSLSKRDWLFILGQSLSAGFLFNFLMLKGLDYTDANIAGIITSALPAIIAILSWLILSETISAQKALCVVFATIGLVIIGADKIHNVQEAHSFFGDMLVLLSLFPEASYYILCKLYTNRLPVFFTSALLNGINSVVLLPIFLSTSWDVSSISIVNWLILILAGLSSGLFYVFWFMGAKYVDGIMASLSTAVMPVATVILAWVILKEQLSITEMMGMGLVLLSIVLYAKR